MKTYIYVLRIYERKINDKNIEKIIIYLESMSLHKVQVEKRVYFLYGVIKIYPAYRNRQAIFYKEKTT